MQMGALQLRPHHKGPLPSKAGLPLQVLQEAVAWQTNPPPSPSRPSICSTELEGPACTGAGCSAKISLREPLV